MNKYLIYKLVNRQSQQIFNNEMRRFTLLRPTIFNLVKVFRSYSIFAIWWIFHHCRIFSNKDFVMSVHVEDNQVIHRTCVFPRYYKFPFMDIHSLQLGEIWTKKEHRNRGLASHAILSLLNMSKYKDRTFWYVVESDNIGSIALAKKLGFAFYGTAQKKKRLGVSFLGQYEIL